MLAFLKNSPGIGLPKFLKFGKSGASNSNSGGVVLLSKQSLDGGSSGDGGIVLLSKQSLADDGTTSIGTASISSHDDDGVMLMSKRSFDVDFSSTDSIDGKL